MTYRSYTTYPTWAFVPWFKCGRTQSFLTGSAYRGEALKDRSEGCWRSGRRRSGDVGGGGTVNDFRYSVSCRDLLSTRRAKTEKIPTTKTQRHKALVPLCLRG